MPDLRDRVEEERGLLKRIQLHVPGFAGYRRREDIRTADNMLRIQMADMLKDARRRVEKARDALAEDYQMDVLDDVGGMISQFRTIEGKVRHAEGGYSGISAAIRIEEAELDRLYEIDAFLLDSIVNMRESAKALQSAASDGDEVPQRVAEISDLLSGFEDSFKRRVLVITGTEVSP